MQQTPATFRPAQIGDQKVFETMIGYRVGQKMVPCAFLGKSLAILPKNPLLKPTISKILPVSTVRGEGQQHQTCLLHPDNALVLPVGLARWKWWYSVDVIQHQISALTRMDDGGLAGGKKVAQSGEHLFHQLSGVPFTRK